MNWTIGKKIWAGLLSLLALLLMSNMVALMQVGTVHVAMAHVTEEGLPVKDAIHAIIEGVSESALATRGYLLTGESQYLETRSRAWKDEVNPAVSQLAELGRKFTLDLINGRVGELKDRLSAFQQAQEETVAIAHTEKDQPARTIWDKEVEPKLSSAFDSVARLVALDQAKGRGTVSHTVGQTGFLIKELVDYSDRFTTHGREEHRRQVQKIVMDLMATIRRLNAAELGGGYEVTTALANISNNISLVVPLVDRIFEIRGRETWNMSQYTYNTKIIPARKAVLDTLAEIEHADELMMMESVGNLEGAISNLQFIETLLIVVGIVAGLLIAFITSRNINTLLSGVAGSLGDSSRQVQTASAQMASAGQSLSQASSEQASSLEEVSSTVEELASMSRQNAEHAKAATEIVETTRSAASSGQSGMKQMTVAMESISESSRKIQSIIKIIDEIAFQTNLLALNAAVEAARAGEHGRGFAVVAGEVRSLAQRSAAAAKDTARLIEDNLSAVGNGVKLAEATGSGFSEIVENINKVTTLVREIATASQEQASGIDQINTAVVQLNSVTQNSAANSEETASTAEELSAQANLLAELVSDLLMHVNGGAAVMQYQAAQATARAAATKAVAKTGANGEAGGNGVAHPEIKFGQKTPVQFGGSDFREF